MRTRVLLVLLAVLRSLRASPLRHPCSAPSSRSVFLVKTFGLELYGN